MESHRQERETTPQTGMNRKRTAVCWFVAACALAMVPNPVWGQALPPLTLRLGLGSGLQTINFPLQDQEVGTGSIQVSPNTPVYAALGVAWRTIGLGLKISLPGTIEAEELRGTTEFTNVQVQLFGDRYAGDLVFQQHEGMYLENASDFSFPVASRKLPDFTIQTIGATFLWSVNPRIRVSTAYKFDDIPEGSALGLVLMGAASRVTMVAPGGPGAGIPALDDTLWSEDIGMQSTSGITGLGFMAFLSYRALFLAPLASAGLGLQHTDYQTSQESGERWALVPQLSIRASAGVNTREWFLVALLSVDARNVQTPYLEATQGSTILEVQYGRRLSL